MENDSDALMKQPTKKIKSNLKYKEHIAMDEPTKRKDLIITSANKGRAVVITAISRKLISNYPTKQQSFTKCLRQTLVFN